MAFPLKGGAIVRRIPVLLALLWASASPAAEGRLPVPVGLEALRERISASSSPSGSVLLFSANDLLPVLFLPLHGEGKVASLTVVVPSDTPFTAQELDSWKSYVAAFSPGSDNGFVLEAGSMTGRIDGLAVRVHPLKEWRDPPKEGPVILDIAFLLARYEDEIRTPVPDLPRTFLEMLDGRKIDPSRLLPWVADRREIPLERGYLPKLVAELARDPGAFRDGLPAKWRALKTGEYLAFLGMYEQSVSHFEGFLKEEPEEPSVLLRIAFTRFVDGDADRGLRFLLRAYNADPYYVRGYAAAGFTLFAKGELGTAERVVRAGLALDPDFLDLKMGLARILLAQAKKRLRNDPAAAEARFREIGSIGLPQDLLDPLTSEWEEAKNPPLSGGTGEDVPPGHPAVR